MKVAGAVAAALAVLWSSGAQARPHHSWRGDDAKRREPTAPGAAPAAPTALAAAPAGSVRVTDIGPEQGVDYSLDGFLIDPGNPSEILVSTEAAGVFKSSDAGRTWRPARAGLTSSEGYPVIAPNIRHDPRDPRTVYAVSEDGLYRSTDFGEQWQALARADLDDVAIDPATPSHLFAVGADYGYAVGAFYVSTDGGATLVRATGTGLPEVYTDRPVVFTCVVASPADPRTVYVVDEYSGIYKSTDGGASFALLPASQLFTPLQIFPHPTRADVLFVQAAYTATGVVRSDDGGATFADVTGGLPVVASYVDGVQFVAFDPRDPSRLYAASPLGLFRSRDGGATFAALGLRPDQLGASVRGGAIAVRVDPVQPTTLYVNTVQGNFRSIDGGRQFSSINRGFHATAVRDVAPFGDDGQGLLVVADYALFRTLDRGQHYEQLPLPPDAFVTAAAVAPSDPRLMFATAKGSKLFRSADGGRSWAAADGPPGFDFARVAVDPRNPGNVYVVAGDLYRSTDGGQTFLAAGILSDTGALAIDPRRPSVLYLSGGVGFDTPLLMKSLDGGQSFAGTLPGIGLITAVATDRFDANVVYAAGLVQQDLTKPYPSYDVDNFLVRSVDGGATFAAADTGLFGRNVAWLGTDPRRSGQLYVYSRGPYAGPYQGSRVTDLLTSQDGGTTWTLLDPLKDTFPAKAFAVDPEEPGRIYLGGASLLEVDTDR